MQDTWRDSKYSMQMFVSLGEAMQRCWSATDALFGAIQDWSAQPIDVRHPFSFYYGHLASFAKLKMLPLVCQNCCEHFWGCKNSFTLGSSNMFVCSHVSCSSVSLLA